MREHHTRNGFRNPGAPAPRRRRWGLLLRWLMGLTPQEPAAVDPAQLPPGGAPRAGGRAGAHTQPVDGKLSVTWIGHATFLIRTDGLNLLTDPVFSERASPSQRVGPRRHVAPGMALDSLPHIDAVLISHNHYDHLDRASVRRLARRFPAARFFVPQGLGRWMQRNGAHNVSEHDWWEAGRCAALTVHCVPARHFSGRGLRDRNRTLWCGWVVESARGHILFAGDTGYSPVFGEIGQRFEPLRLALLPIGAYRPRSFMAAVHIDPPEAVRIHRELGARHSIGMHWGTFRLTDEPLNEPPAYLRQACREAGVDDTEFGVMAIGETRLLDWHQPTPQAAMPSLGAGSPAAG